MITAEKLVLRMNFCVPEQLRALALVAGEDLERGLSFIRGCFDLKASQAEKQNENRSDLSGLWSKDDS